jgi:hypothetical protein
VFVHISAVERAGQTLLDALTMLQHVEQILEKTSTKANPIYCLLEDDSLVSGLGIETERLLTDQSHSADFARLTIEVDVRVRLARIYNQSFLG